MSPRSSNEERAPRTSEAGAVAKGARAKAHGRSNTSKK